MDICKSYSTKMFPCNTLTVMACNQKENIPPFWCCNNVMVNLSVTILLHHLSMPADIRITFHLFVHLSQINMLVFLGRHVFRRQFLLRMLYWHAKAATYLGSYFICEIPFAHYLQWVSLHPGSFTPYGFFPSCLSHMAQTADTVTNNICYCYVNIATGL